MIFLPANPSSKARSSEAQTRLVIARRKGTVRNRSDHETEASQLRIDIVLAADSRGRASIRYPYQALV